MIIREILDLSLQKPINEIAKEHLDIGEKPTREALKKAGCFTRPGKKGWFFDGNEEILNQSIYDFHEGNITPKETKTTKNNIPINEPIKETSNEPKRVKIRKRFSVDLDSDLIKILKMRAIVDDRHLYELVEEAITRYIKETE